MATTHDTTTPMVLRDEIKKKIKLSCGPCGTLDVRSMATTDGDQLIYGQYKMKTELLHHPGIEPGSSRWQRPMIPLHQWCENREMEKKSPCGPRIDVRSSRWQRPMIPLQSMVREGAGKGPLHHPGIEPGSSRWQRPMIPLHQWCSE